MQKYKNMSRLPWASSQAGKEISNNEKEKDMNHILKEGKANSMLLLCCLPVLWSGIRNPRIYMQGNVYYSS